MHKFLVLAAIFSMGVHVSDMPSPSVHGIKLHDTQADVHLALGPPISQETHTYNDCNPHSDNVRWHYPGLSITFSEQNQEALVSELTIYEGNWSLNGIHLDDSVNRVKNTFGDADFIHDVLPYNNRGDASWEFTIRNQLVKAISLKQSHCHTA